MGGEDGKGSGMIDNNPYASPVDTSTGHYDWSLAKQALLACSMIAILWLAAIVIPAWREYSASRSLRSPRERIESFFLDWKADPRLSKQ